MRCVEAISLIWHTGHSEEIHSPDEWARTVVRRRRPASLSMPVAWIVADVVRFEDGLLKEHWDVLQDEVTKVESVSGLPMFGDRFPS